MLTIAGERRKSCDQVSRRNFLQIGALGIGGLTFADLLRAEEQHGIRSSNKAVINIFLGGGPPHQDMWDLKPNAPAEIRGEFVPVSTNVPGMQICQLFQNLSGMADKFAVVRSLVGSVGAHSSFQCQTAYSQRDLASAGGRPALGSIVSKLQGTETDNAPPFVTLTGKVSGGYLGPAYNAYSPGSVRSSLSLNAISAERLDDRKGLLSSMDKMRRDADNSGAMEAMDSFTQRAVSVITSGKLANALDLSKEDPKLLDRYRNGTNRSARQNDRFLLARRIIQAGVRVVSMSWGGWDTHGQNFDKLRTQLPALDLGLSTLIQDLEAHDMLQDVSIVMWGEFGRTPKVNSKAGRDHWPKVGAAFLAGGGMRTGQAIGMTDRYAGEAQDRPVHFQEVFATLYHNLGIDLSTQLKDHNGRPHFLVDMRTPIRELV